MSLQIQVLVSQSQVPQRDLTGKGKVFTELMGSSELIRLDPALTGELSPYKGHS